MNKEIIKDVFESGNGKAVEMQEFILQDKIVYKVSVFYNIRKILWKYTCKEYVFPFYFETKEIVQEFLKYWDDFEIVYGEYFNNNYRRCYQLKHHNITSNEYWMVDAFKWKQREYYDGYCHLEKGGVWGGIINTDAHYRIYQTRNFRFIEIFNIDNIARETSNTYVFKMIK